MNNSAKLWIQKTLNQAAITRAEQVIKLQGKSLPCKVVAVNGSIVTVSFQVNSNSKTFTLPRITIPKAESNWFRTPTQIGDTGITVPADIYIGIISGLGATIPNMQVRPSNLGAIVFLPVSNSNSPPSDQNAAIAQGPNGFIGQVAGGTSSVVANTSDVTLTFGANTVVINSTGMVLTWGTQTITLNSAGITMDGNGQTLSLGTSGITMSAAGQTFALSSSGVVINGLNFGSHYHTGVTTGTANTGGPA